MSKEKTKQTEMTRWQNWLARAADSLRPMLPAAYQPETERFLTLARWYVQRDEKLHDVTAQSLADCVLKAGTLGFPLDGRLVYAVPFNNKRRDASGKDYWAREATCMFDYKALLAYARRMGLVKDAWSRIVMKGDQIDLDEQDGKQTYSFKPNLDTPRDMNEKETRGVLSVAVMPSGAVRVDWMPYTDIKAIQNRSKAASKGFSPWESDWGQMALKTGTRRLLKPITDDPGMLLMMSDGYEETADKSGAATAETSPEDFDRDVLGLPAPSEPFIPPVQTAEPAEQQQVEEYRESLAPTLKAHPTPPDPATPDPATGKPGKKKAQMVMMNDQDYFDFESAASIEDLNDVRVRKLAANCSPAQVDAIYEQRLKELSK